MVGLAAGLATVQLWLARWSGILDLAAAYRTDAPAEWGNDEWPPQLFVISWCVASAVITAAAASEPFVRTIRWRYALAGIAALGALAPLPLVRDWASTADPQTATAALTRGVLVGAAASAVILMWRAAGRSSLLWVGWIELNAAATVLTSEYLGRSGRVPDQSLGPSPWGPPLGIYLWGRSEFNEVGMVALLPGVVLAGVLAWWAKRRGERFALLGAVTIPVVLVAIYFALLGLHPGVAPGQGLGAWTMLALLGFGAAALGTLVATMGSWTRRERLSSLITSLTAAPRTDESPGGSWRPPDGRPWRPARLRTTETAVEEAPPATPHTEALPATQRMAARLATRTDAPLITRRTLAGAGAALAVAACAATAQLWLGRRLQVVVPDQDYGVGNDTWPFQLVLLTWCATCAAVIGGIVGGSAVRHGRGRCLTALAAAVGALVPAPRAVGWAMGATEISAEPGSAAVAACVVGAVLGASVVAAAQAAPGIDRSATAWMLLVWLSVLTEVLLNRIWTDWVRVVPVHPLGLITPGWLADNPLADLAGWLPPLVLASVLGWVAARRNERGPALIATVGPLLVSAVHLVVSWLPGARLLGDHYVLSADLQVWLILSVLAFTVAAFGSRLAGQRQPRRFGRRA
ncbi:hypothetical protein D7193_02975 [Micromonospora costi]|uniref:Uncharacterized protein n=2 Tax=Micromonospora costi TaxID=1530042 RepID=A0A3B0AAI8_9ACTN|nr:hypothetical protein D7193_02975 [Micromonospora costi]